jgi:hypothetical protein
MKLKAGLKVGNFNKGEQVVWFGEAFCKSGQVFCNERVYKN